MDSTIIIAVLSTLAAAVGGVFAWARFFRKDKADAVASELSNEGKERELQNEQIAYEYKLREEVSKLVKEQLDTKREFMRSEQRAAAAEMQLEIEKGLSQRIENRFANVYAELGAARQREELCLQQRDADALRIRELEIKVGIGIL